MAKREIQRRSNAQKITREQAYRILERSGGRCERCRGTFMLAIHHDPPKQMGGTKRVYTDDMLELLCIYCHNEAHGIRVKRL